MPTRKCPHCGDVHDQATKASVDRVEEIGTYVPKSNEVGLCWSCGGIFAMTHDGKTRLLEGEEVGEVLAYPEVQKALEAWARFHTNRRGGEAQG